MKKILLFVAMSLTAVSLSAATISFTSIGFASGAFEATGNANVPTSLTFSNVLVGGLLNCAGPSAILCAPNGLGVVSINNTIFDSGGAPSVFQLGLGLTYTTDSVWTTNGSLATGLTIFTSGTYSSSVAGFTPAQGVLNFSLQPPSDGSSSFGKFNLSASGLTHAPEPGSIFLVGAGLVGLGLLRRKRFGVSK